MDDTDTLEQALKALGDLLLYAGEIHRVVVVGGVAIVLGGYHSRSTADVDVIARVEDVEAQPLLIPPDPLPGPLLQAIEQVGNDFGLDPEWMNTVVAKQWDQGLPPYAAEELTWRTYGGLEVGLAGRKTLIALKLFAAVDLGARSVHMQDLLRLVPSEEELVEAASWVVTQDVSPIFQSNVQEAVTYVRTHAG